MICILVFACVLFRQGKTSQGTSEEKKTRMIQEWSRISAAYCDLFVLASLDYPMRNYKVTDFAAY